MDQVNDHSNEIEISLNRKPNKSYIQSEIKGFTCSLALFGELTFNKTTCTTTSNSGAYLLTEISM